LKALIWAAGFGTRLLPLTKKLPKPLFPVVNIPMINLIIRYLQAHGVWEFGINTHYLRELLVKHLRNLPDTNLFITEEKEEILGTGGGTLQFRNFLKDEDIFIVHTSDILTDIDLNEAIEFHKKHNNIATLILVDHEPINHVSLLEDGTIRDIKNILGRQHSPEVKNLAGSGITIYSSEIFRWLPDKKKSFEINPVWLEIIKKGDGRIKGYIAKKPYYWRDIGTVRSYWEAHRDILIKRMYPLNGSEEFQKHIAGPETKIDPGVTLEGFTVLGAGVKVEGNIRVKNSVIWENVSLSGEETIENSIITKDCRLIV